MSRKAILGLALAMTIAACGSEASEDDSAAAAAADEGTTAEAEPAAGAAAAPAGVSPDRPGDRKARLRNWALLEFVEPVQEADLEWLGENGFVVDTVMGEKLVRGWLEEPEGGEVISTDPRIARVSAQAR